MFSYFTIAKQLVQPLRPLCVAYASCGKNRLLYRFRIKQPLFQLEAYTGLVI